MGQYINMEVDIEKYPECSDSSDDNSLLVFGDIDGNAIKLLHFLVREGILKMPATDYATLVRLCRISPNKISESDIAGIKEIISTAKANATCPEIIFLGDEVSDRGPYDNVTLYLFEKLHKENIKYTIIESNHGAEFLSQFAYGLERENITLFTDEYHHFGNSLHNLQTLIDNDIVNLYTIEEIIETHYLPTKRLLHYSIRDSDAFMLFSHAPVDISALFNLADYFKVPFEVDTPAQMGAMISSINQIYQALLLYLPIRDDCEYDWKALVAVVNKTYHQRLSDENSDDVSNFLKAQLGIDIQKVNFRYELPKIPVMARLLNDRYQNILVRKNDQLSLAFAIINIHGHVGNCYMKQGAGVNWKYCNLDGDLGKNSESNQGTYRVYKVKAEPAVIAQPQTKEIEPEVPPTPIESNFHGFFSEGMLFLSQKFAPLVEFSINKFWN